MGTSTEDAFIKFDYFLINIGSDCRIEYTYLRIVFINIFD